MSELDIEALNRLETKDAWDFLDIQGLMQSLVPIIAALEDRLRLQMDVDTALANCDRLRAELKQCLKDRDRLRAALAEIAVQDCDFPIYGDASRQWRDCGKCGICQAKAARATLEGRDG